MKLCYLPVEFCLHFESPAYADVYPPFIMRSLLGCNLRKMCCVAHTNECSECMYNRTCAYSTIFETIISGENNILPGTVRASHPFAITDNTRLDSKKRVLSDYRLTITLMGHTIEYLPYIYAAIARAGKGGMFKSRTPFEVTDIKVGGQSILLDPENIQTDVPIMEFNSDSFTGEKRGDVLVELITPMRFKIGGKYASDFSADEFFTCISRRMKNLCTMYGESDDKSFLERSEIEISMVNKNLRWNDYRHYSGRQKTAMELGGVTGTFTLRGNFSKNNIN